MTLSVLLADAATNDPNGKVNALGAGWSFIGTPLPPHAVFVVAEIEHDHHNEPLSFTFELLDADDQVVTLEGPAGPQPIRQVLQGMLALPPPGAPKGTPSNLTAQLSVAGPGFDLVGGATYKWRVTLSTAAGVEVATGVARFYVVQGM